ncbi:MAG: glycosyltransferase family 4 protein [Acetobacteraceae bacterium]|nr:glycosyltransferase family 4 protein [Acetobacteraceae bacterium]
MLHQHFSLSNGSQPGRGSSLAEALAAQGHDVTLICGMYVGGSAGAVSPFGFGYRSSFVSGYRIIQIRLPYSNALKALQRLKIFLLYSIAVFQHAFRHPWDLVIGTSTPLTIVIPLMVLRVFWRARCIFEVRDRWPELLVAMNAISAPSAIFLGFLERVSKQIADMYVGLSPTVISGFQEIGCRLGSIHLISNGWDIDHFKDRRFLIERMRGNGGNILAIYLGTIGKANGLDILLDGAKLLQCLEKKVRFLVVGEGNERERLLWRVVSEGILNVMFVDPLPRIRLGEILSRADIAIHCLEDIDAFADGTSPNKIFEAMGAGLPIVTNCQGWIAQRLCEVEAGFAVPPRDRSAFAEKVAMLAGDSMLRRKMGMAARALAEAEFARTLQKRQFCELIRE